MADQANSAQAHEEVTTWLPGSKAVTKIEKGLYEPTMHPL